MRKPHLFISIKVNLKTAIMKNLIFWIFYFLSISLINAQVWSTVGDGLGTCGNNQDRVHALCNFNGSLYAGGSFDSSGLSPIRNIAKWNGSVWSPVGSGCNNMVYAMAEYNGDLYVGGAFDSVGNIPARRIAKWDGNNWSSLGSGCDDIVSALTVYNGDLYAGGVFDTIDGIYSSGIAKWNGSNWVSIGIFLQVYYAISFCTYNNELYAGCVNLLPGGMFKNSIAKWNGSSWSNVGRGIAGNLYNSVFALTVYNNELYVGGLFDSAGVVSTKNIAKWNGVNWSSVGGGVAKGINGANPYVLSLKVYNNELYAAGQFDTAGLSYVSRIARWNGNTWNAVGGGIIGTPMSEEIYNNELFVGGNFCYAGGIGALNAQNVVRWSMPTAIENYEDIPRIKIYPVPAKKNITVETDFEILSWLLLDELGRTIIVGNPNANKFEIPCDNLNLGIYTLIAKNDKRCYYKKIIK